MRHLIEHRKGKVDQRFIAEVASKPLWRNSSWSDIPLALGATVEVRVCDFDATCTAMLRAAQIITDMTCDCWVE